MSAITQQERERRERILHSELFTTLYDMRLGLTYDETSRIAQSVSRALLITSRAAIVEDDRSFKDRCGKALLTAVHANFPMRKFANLKREGNKAITAKLLNAVLRAHDEIHSTYPEDPKP